ncbi:MAG TPA: hypothetical protein PK199_09050, partial [Bacteroidales bacterium]|nr:hypothetical protein [Bacteroidales bacterium]
MSNFGTDSNNNTTTIEYDNYISSFHTTIVRTATASLQTWGEDIGNDGLLDVLAPLTIDYTNFPALGTVATHADVLKGALGSNYVNAVQGIVLATDGLYAWSTEGIVLDASITTGTAFEKLTIGGNANGLPTGVTPANVKMMFATYQTLAIVTCSGDLWVISQNANVRGNGATGSNVVWSRVTTTAVGNPFLTNVVACRGSAGALIALKSDGTVYVWGSQVYLGNNTAKIVAQTRAEQMTLPVGITPKLIGSTVNIATNFHSFYVLGTDGNMYAVGENSARQLGDFTTTDRLAWVQPRYAASPGPVMNNILWFSPQEHDTQFAAVNVVNSSKNLYAFGENAFTMLGTTANPSNPVIPNGLTTSDLILTVETGGHTSMVVRNCDPNFGYVGHRIRGSMGDGTPASTTETIYTFATAPMQICGAESLPIIQPVGLATGSTPSTYCVGSYELLDTSPPGGTLSIQSGPGILSGNTVTFTGVGTVVVHYLLPVACGGIASTTRSLVTEFCSNDLRVTKTVNNSTPSVGSNVIFTIVATNAGSNIATGVNVTDLLPTGYTYVSSTVSTGTYTSGTGVWAIGSLANGASQTLTVTATVNGTGNYANTATVAADGPDPTSGNNTATNTPTVAQANVAVVKTVNNATPNVGSNVTFTIVASNAGPSAATGVNVTDLLPTGYTYVSSTVTTGTYTSGTGVWAIGGLANGASQTLTVTATVNATGVYANTATIVANEADPTPANNTSTNTPTPVAQSNVGVVKTVDNATPNVGSNVTFTIVANNAGPSAATGVNVNDLLPTGYTYVSSTVTTGTYTSGTGVWAIGTIANGASQTLTVTATVNATGVYANTATITANEADPTPANNTSTNT